MMKRRIIAYFVILLLVGLPGGSFGAESDNQEKIDISQHFVRIAAFGDDFMSGYGLVSHHAYYFILQRQLRERGYNIRVVNSSVVGDTSGGGVMRVANVVALKPDIVILELGVNDMLSGIDIQLTYKNLDNIITKLKEERIWVLLMGMKAPATASPEYQKKFEGMYEYLAKKHKIPFYPYLLKDVTGNTEMNIADGVHPNMYGAEKMVGNTLPYVMKMTDRIVIKKAKEEADRSKMLQALEHPNAVKSTQ